MKNYTNKLGIGVLVLAISLNSLAGTISGLTALGRSGLAVRMESIDRAVAKLNVQIGSLEESLATQKALGLTNARTEAALKSLRYERIALVNGRIELNYAKMEGYSEYIIQVGESQFSSMRVFESGLVEVRNLNGPRGEPLGTSSELVMHPQTTVLQGVSNATFELGRMYSLERPSYPLAVTSADGRIDQSTDLLKVLSYSREPLANKEERRRSIAQFKVYIENFLVQKRIKFSRVDVREANVGGASGL